MIALLATALITGLSHYQGTGRFDNIFYDLASRVRPAKQAENITIIGIDEESLSQVGKWPWPRDRHIAAFEHFQNADPKAVAFDILLTESGDAQTDKALADAMASTGKTFLPMQYISPGRNGRLYDELAPAPPYLAAAKGTGHVNLSIDGDGVLRRMVPCFTGDERSEPRPHLMEIVYRYGEGEPSEATAKRDCTRSLLLPLEPRSQFKYISYGDFISGRVPPAFLDGQYVLIGATAGGLGDQYIVAGGNGGTMAGVTVMANYLNAMLTDAFIKPVGGGLHILLSLLPSWILLLGLWRWQPRTTLYVSGILLLALLAATVLALYLSYWFAPGAALAGLALIYPTWGWRRLQATSSFMESELDRMDQSLPPLMLPSSPFEPVDIVTGQAEKMSQAISQMRDLRRFVSDTLTQLPDPMLVADLEGGILLSNAHAAAIFGSNAEERNIDELLRSYIVAEDWDKVQTYLHAIRGNGHEDGKPLAYTEFTARNAQSYALRCSPVLSGEGFVRGHIFYLADITAISDARREREEVLQLLSHDMRAPQSAILALLEKREGKVSGDVRKRISQQAHRTLNLADNFIDIARMKDRGFEPEDMLLADMMHQAADGLWPLASARNITFTFDDQSQDAFVEGEQASMFRAITNLYDNAIKYSPDGGMIHTKLRRLQLGYQDHVRAQIIDQGGGISDSILPELFGKFVSKSGVSKARVQGIGLGLHHVESVIARHGG